ncbi:MAG: hypothetical protein ACI9TY_000505 [Alphaproteobacteria bacterium]|jgi:hypothetical protein
MLSGIIAKLMALVTTTGGFILGKTWFLSTILKPLQAVIYVFMQAKVKNFMRNKKKLSQEIYDSELDVEDFSLNETVDTFRTKHGIITQRMKKIRKLNQDILDLWIFLQKYGVTFGGDDGARLMYEIEAARREMQEAVRAYPKLLMEMRTLDNYYNKEEIEVEDRLASALMERAQKWSFFGKYLRAGLYIVLWYYCVDLFFSFTYDVIDTDSNLHAYMLEVYAQQILYYHNTIQTTLTWSVMGVGYLFMCWKLLFPGKQVYIEFTRRCLLAMRGIAILSLGVLFVYASMHWVLPLLLKDGVIYEVFLKDYPQFASILANTLFGLFVLVAWGYLTFKSAKKLFFDPRQIKTTSVDNFRAKEFYGNQKEICKKYTHCAESYYTLVILIEYIQEQKEDVFDDFTNLASLQDKAKQENAFFNNLNVKQHLEELDAVLPSRYAYKVKKQETQQDV